MLKIRHQLTTNYFAQRLRAPHGRCHDFARARAEGSTAADSPRHAFGADNRVADVAGGDRSGVFDWSAVADLRSCGCLDSGGGHAGSDRLTRRTADRRSRSFRHAAKPVGSRYSDFGPTYSGPRQEYALNLSAKRRLCNTVGKRFIDGTTRCCVVSTARSRAAATTNLARSSLALWSLRRIPGGAKSSVLVNLFMICPLVG